MTTPDRGWRRNLGARGLGVIAMGVLLAVVAADRWRWASLSQWREDQATNLWLGYTRGLGEIPVGLISSVGVPNPNGMVLLGKALSWLPGLMEVSWALGIIQGALAMLLALSLSLGWLPRAALMLVLLSSVVMRATSVELWNQWVLTSLNLAFAASVALFVRRPSPLWLPAWSAMAMIAPSLYLAGVVNAVTIVVVGALLLLVYRPRASVATWAATFTISVLLAGASTWATWIPYLEAVPPGAAAGAASTPVLVRIVLTLASVLQVPVWWPAPWLLPSSFVVLQSSWAILPEGARSALGIASAILAVQYVAFLAACYAAARRWNGTFARGISGIVSARPALQQVGWIALAVAVAHVTSPILGGPALALGQRLEMGVQWLPLLLVTWFGGTFALARRQRIEAILAPITVGMAVLWGTANLGLGSIVQDAYLSYRGDVLLPADVPLVQKVELVEYVASDSRARGTGAVSIDYDLGGGHWDWVARFGEGMQRWYPAPMTIGRAFDYELLRRHGLRNEREGNPRTPRQGARYVVTYASRAPPEGDASRHVEFGRLRLTVRDH